MRAHHVPSQRSAFVRWLERIYNNVVANTEGPVGITDDALHAFAFQQVKVIGAVALDELRRRGLYPFEVDHGDA